MRSTKKTSKTKDVASYRDRLLGARVRLRRTFLGWTQVELAEKLGVVPQQVQKYEAGFNKLSASRLIEVSDALGVPVEYFYTDFVGVWAQDGLQRSASSMNADPLVRPESTTLIKNFNRIEDAGLRKTVFDTIRQLALASKT